MRLLIVTPSLEGRSSTERTILKIAQRFSAKIHCVHYDQALTYEDFSKLDVEVAKPTALSKLPAGKHAAAMIEAGYHFLNAKFTDFDIINAHQAPSEWVRSKNSPILWYCLSPKRDMFDLYEREMTLRGPLSKACFFAQSNAFRFFEQRAVQKIEHIFTASRASQDRITKYLHRSSEVLAPGIESERYSCKDYERFFFYPTRIAPEKELEYAIEAFKIFSKRVSSKPGTGNWKLVIAGSLSKRPDHQAYMKRIKAICDASIEIKADAGEWEIRDLYARCFCVLYPPICEDYDHAPLEGFASSKPCIARSDGGAHELIQEGRNGFIVNSIWEMAGKMEGISKDPDRCAQMGKAGRSRIEKEFTWERFLSRFGEKAEEMIRYK